MGVVRDQRPYDAECAHKNSPNGFTHVFILPENIHATRVETLSAKELGT